MRATVAVRKIMQAFGKNRIYTNTYDNCQTVKCYADTKNPENDRVIMGMLDFFFTRHNVDHQAKIYQHYVSRHYRTPASIIVRLPLGAMINEAK